MQEELKVKLADAKACYANASNEVKEALEHLFGKEPFEFNYRGIKSFDDACKHLNISNYVPTSREGFIVDEQAADQSAAMYKLMVICKAICNGKYTDEYGDSWFPYYWLYSKQELASMGEEQRKAKGIQLLSACAARSAGVAGVRYANANNRGANTNTNYGFPLYMPFLWYKLCQQSKYRQQ